MKRKIAVSLVLAMLISFCAFVPSQALSAQEGAAWAEKQIGKSIDFDGLHGAQCVDLIKQYCYVHWKWSPMGHGKDYATIALPDSSWKRIKNTADFVPQPGDIAIWANGTYGHVAIVLSGNLNTFESVDQNWYNSDPKEGSPAAKVTHNYTNFWGVIRPPFTSNATQKPTLTVKSGTVSSDTSFTWTGISGTCRLDIKYMDDVLYRSYGLLNGSSYSALLPAGTYKASIIASNGEVTSENIVFTVQEISNNNKRASIYATSINSGRGTNQLAIFTSACGASTKTNQYGTECVVDSSGVVKSVSTAGNAVIPQDGFVLSGHGNMEIWLKGNVVVGDKISICPKSLHIVVSKDGSDILSQEVNAKNTEQTAIDYNGYSKITATGIDRARGKDCLIIFTSNYGTKTNTNEWGAEYIINKNNIVEAIKPYGSGGNATIPSGGFVISAFERVMYWLNSKIQVGDVVHFDRRTMNIYIFDGPSKASASAADWRCAEGTFPTEIDGEKTIDINGKLFCSNTINWVGLMITDSANNVVYRIDKYPQRKNFDLSEFNAVFDSGSLVPGMYFSILATTSTADNSLYYAVSKEITNLTTIEHNIVTFNSSGGVCSTASKEVTNGSSYGVLPIPTREGYSFNGWYTSANGGTRITEESVVNLTASCVLYAQWSALSYTVHFDSNGGVCNTNSKTVTNGADYGTLPIPVREGYSFNGWYTNANGGLKITAASTVNLTSSQELYAQWSEVVLTGILVKSLPLKTSYYVGDTLNTDGLTLTSTYNNGTTGIITSGFVCTPKQLNAPGTQSITVTYGGKSCCFNVDVASALPEENLPIMTISSASVSVGGTVKVTVDIKNNPGIIATSLSIAFDDSLLTLVSVEDGGLLGKNSFIPGNDLSKNPYTVTWEDGLATSDYTENGTLVTYTFKVSDTAPAGAIPIAISCVDGSTFNMKMDDVKFNTADGIITVSSRKAGDVNGDGDINLKDVVILKRYLADGWDVTINAANADVNGDGDVNLKDVVILKRYLAGGWNVTLI